jgi:hypothetical protein
VLQGLARPIGYRLTWGVLKSLVLGGVSFGLLPLIAWTRNFRAFATAGEFLKALSVAQPPPIPRQPATGAPPVNFQQPAVATRGRTTCPHCHQAITSEDNFCMHCGVQLVSHVLRCNKCGAYPDPRDRYCILCGEELSVPAIL